MEEKTEVFMITEQSLQDRIYTIREQKVMLDFELAEIYGYTTTRFNEQVKNNIYTKRPKILDMGGKKCYN